MDTIKEIYRLIETTDKILVFTSETIARNTLLSYIRDNKGKAVFKDRFISFDRFSLSLASTGNLRKVSETERRAFVASFIKNHGLSSLSYFASDKYSESTTSFIRYISRILPYFPSLKNKNISFLEKKMAKDIEKLRGEYEEFLIARGLYEERYLERDLSKIEKDKVVLVYPSSFTSSFAEEVVKSGLVQVIEQPTSHESLGIHEYRNSISEIRGIMRMIERDLKDYSPSEIAITSSSLDTYRPYMEIEAKKRDIPLLFTSRLPLSSYPEGKLVSQFFDIHRNNWSLSSYKRLFSDPSFPFKDRDTLFDILHIGVDMKLEGGGYKHWMKAFDINADNKKYGDVAKAKALFDSLYKAISLIVKADKSLDTEFRIRSFRDTFLMEGEWREDEDRIQGSILEILEGLKEVKDENIYQIFLSIMKDTYYVENSEGEEYVKVYAYPASAGLRTKRHYIIGLDDKSTQLVVDDYPFSSSPDKPKGLDVGKNILSLYSDPSFSPFTYLSGTTLGYDGSRLLPTLFLDRIERVDSICEDSYSEERNKDNTGIKCTLSQKDSYTKAKIAALKEREKTPIIKDILSQERLFSVSEIKSWDTCPFKGYSQSVLKLRKTEYECEMEDHFEKGEILHETMENALKEKGNLSLLDDETLKKYLALSVKKSMESGKIPDKAVECHIYSSILRKLSSFNETKGIEVYSNGDLVKNEVSFSGHRLGENVLVKGRLDTLLKDKNDRWYILDYKLRGSDDWSKDSLSDMSLQVILYYMLLTSPEAEGEVERNGKVEVESGGFYSLSDRKFKIIWPTQDNQGFTLESVLDNANERIEHIIKAMETGEITIDSSEDNCKNCDYKRLCRGRFVAQ